MMKQENIPENQELILEDHGINWIWYCHCTISNGIAKVSKEYRLHKFDDFQGAHMHPKAIGNYRIKEQEIKRNLGDKWPPRIAIGIEINGIFFPFANPISRWS